MRAAPLPAVPTASLRIRHANVVDVAAREVRPDSIITIEDGTIASVGPDPAEPIGATDLDAHGAFALPGLIDAHVHVTALSADEYALTGMPMSFVAAAAARELEATLRRGFTTVRDAGGADEGLARALAAGLVDGPRLVYCGHALSATGGHGDLRPRGRYALEHQRLAPGLSYVVDGVDALRTAVRDEIRAGAGFIKLMISGGVASPTDAIDDLQFSDVEITAAVDEAARHGIGVAAHAYTAESVIRAVRLGIRTIEHGNLIDDAAAVAMAEAGTFYVPTLSTYEVLAEQGADGLPADSIAKVAGVRARGREAVRTAASHGVPIAFGTDLLGTMRDRQAGEFALRADLQDAWDVLAGATVVAADLLGLPGRLGTLTEGAAGDVVLCRSDPSASPGALADPGSVAAVVVAGREVTR